MNRLRLVSSLWLPLLLAAVPVVAQPARPGARGQAAAGGRDRAHLQMDVMEEAFVRGVEVVHGRALEALQVSAGMPPVFTFETNPRARAFRLDGYGVFFDVDLPPIPRSVEWQLNVLDTGAALAPEIEQLRQQVERLNDPRAARALEIIRSMQSKVAVGNALAVDAGRAGVQPEGEPSARLVQNRPTARDDPFKAYVEQLKQTLVQIMLEYGPTIRLAADDWLTVAAREMAPKLMPGNPTEATITLRIKGSDLSALKAGQLAPEEAQRRIDVKEIY